MSLCEGLFEGFGINTYREEKNGEISKKFDFFVTSKEHSNKINRFRVFFFVAFLPISQLMSFKQDKLNTKKKK